MALYSVAPRDMQEDEHRIGSGYRLWVIPALVAIPLIVAYFIGDLKWVVAASACVAIIQLNEIGGRLYDLCIRARRTNLLLAAAIKNTEQTPSPEAHPLTSAA